MIELSHETELQIREEGEATYPNECCGVLFGHFTASGDAKVTAILPIENAREAEAQYNRFVITADDSLRAERAAQKLGVDVLGFITRTRTIRLFRRNMTGNTRCHFMPTSLWQ